MNFRSTRLLSFSVIAAMAVALPATAQREEGESPQDVKDQSPSTVERECGDNSLVFTGDQKLWPPNHKYQDYLVAVTDNEGDGLMVTTRITHDEFIVDFLPEDEEDQPGDEEQGAGNTQQDADPFFQMDTTTGGTIEHPARLRSERSGRGDGREYAFVITVEDGDDSCEYDGRAGQDDYDPDFEIEVPHDMRSHRAPAKEDKTGSTGPNQDG